MKVLLKSLLCLGGLALFGWYLSKIGLAAVWTTLAKIGPYAPLVLFPYFVVYLVDCLAWVQTLPPNRPRFWTLLRIRWAGESINNLIPSAYIGGEATKVMLLREHGIGATAGASSAVISKTAQTLAQVCFVVFASIFLFQLAGANASVRAGVGVIIAGGILAVASLFAAQRYGASRVAELLLRVVPISSLARHKEKLKELDHTIRDFYHRSPARFYRSASFYFCGWFLDTVEIFFVAWLLGLPISWTQALVIEAFAGVSKILGMWVPGAIGVQESGIVLIGRIAGIPETLGAAYALIRRARELIFTGVGLLFVYGSQSQPAPAPVPAAKI